MNASPTFKQEGVPPDRWLALSPLDAWTFRDGRPGSPWSGASMDLECLFPPYAATVAGAIRAALARGRGWRSGDWSRDESLRSVLGNGPEDLGVLAFGGPFLTRRDGDDSLFPIPRHLLGFVEDGRWRPATLLAPGPPVRCDLGPEARDRSEGVSLPRPVTALPGGRALKEPDQLFITSDGLRNVLRGELPAADDAVSAQDLFSFERRIGLEIEDEKKTAAEGLLYSPQFVRLSAGVELAVGVAGVPPGWSLPEMLPLGGESRLAVWRRTRISIPAVDPTTEQRIREDRRGALILLTPARGVEANGGHSIRPGMQLVPGVTVVSACCARPLRVGGWNSVESRPEPQVPHLPAGSVLFVEGTSHDGLDELMRTEHIGERNSLGLGRCVLGAWPSASATPA